MNRMSMLLLGTMVVAGAAQAQTFPTKPIRIVTSSAGGGNDVSSRVLATGLAPRLGRAVVIENHAGNGVATDMAVKAAPDGYTLTVAGSPLWLTSYLNPQQPDPMKDLAAISMLASSPFILLVNPSVPANTVPELIAYAKANPGKLNFAHGQGAGTAQLAMELLKSKTGTDIVPIPFKGTNDGINAVMAGQVQMMFGSSTNLAQVKAGKLRALAVSSLMPTPLAPGLPTIASFNLPGYEAASNLGILAPIKTPAAIQKKLNEEIVATLSSPEIQKRFFDLGRDAMPTTQAEAVAKIQYETTNMGKIIKDLGLKEE